MSKWEENSQDELIHYGVKGMKWGVRKQEDNSKPVLKKKTEDIQVTTKNGTQFTLSGNKTGLITKLMARVKPDKIPEYNQDQSFTIRDKNGKGIGEMYLYMDGPKSLNVNWIGINDSQRGNGYARAAMNAVVDHAKRQGLEKLTLEVPGNSPDARHIYESIGFKEVYTPPDLKEPDPVWGGLTNMEMDLKHGGLLHYDAETAQNLLRDMGIG